MRPKGNFVPTEQYEKIAGGGLFAPDSRFYWSINLGALISYTLVSYVCQYGLPFLGGPDWGFMVGYFIPCIAMVLALVVFLAGTPR